uniref:Permuted papain-like amidase enzyme, YaeF/YiiX, C92 family n=1 Tax=Podoviridae sp. ctYKD14 TaxID=2827740 RepID=A0A8S5S4G1_9CAUD|nr:MAG TPA: Permuted papain-like amidase enzyme, YaeF/YiiX, C92 family [Podoviridae sp. ctYKD14]
MSVYVAFYKGCPRPGAPLRERVKYLFDGAIRIITRSPYSHCELAIPDTTRPGIYYCVSASVRDGGVRGKYMALPGDRWDLLPAFDLKGRRTITDAQVSDRLRVHEGQKYDWLGVFRFICPILRQSKNRWFCSEFVATVLGMDNPERQTPQTVYQYLKTT